MGLLEDGSVNSLMGDIIGRSGQLTGDLIGESENAGPWAARLSIIGGDPLYHDLLVRGLLTPGITRFREAQHVFVIQREEIADISLHKQISARFCDAPKRHTVIHVRVKSAKSWSCQPPPICRILRSARLRQHILCAHLNVIQ